MASTFTSQPKDWVVFTNQSRADLSASDNARRDIPISVSPLISISVNCNFGHFDNSRLYQTWYGGI